MVKPTLRAVCLEIQDIGDLSEMAMYKVLPVGRSKVHNAIVPGEHCRGRKKARRISLDMSVSMRHEVVFECLLRNHTQQYAID